MGKRYVYPATTSKFVRRHKTLMFEDMTECRAELTPYTYAEFMKPCTGPRGGKAYKRCYRDVWCVDGILYRLAKGRTEDGEWYRYLAPLSGNVWDRYATGLEPAVLKDGLAV